MNSPVSFGSLDKWSSINVSDKSLFGMAVWFLLNVSWQLINQQNVHKCYFSYQCTLKLNSFVIYETHRLFHQR